MKTFRDHWFWSEIEEQKSFYGYALLASLFANIFAFAVSIFSMVVYDRILPNNATESLISLLIGLILILTLDYLVRQTRSNLLDYAGNRIDKVISEKLFKNIILRSGYAAERNSGVTASIIRDFDVLKEFLAAATVTTFVDIPFSLMFLLVIYIFSGYLVLVPIVTILVLLTVGTYSHYVMSVSSKSISGVNQSKHSMMFEFLSARDTIVCLGRDEYFANKWNKAVADHAEWSTASRKNSNRATNAVNLMTQLNQIAIITVGVVVTSMTGSLVAATLLAGRAIAPYSAIVNLLTRLSQAIQSYKSISKALEINSHSLTSGAVDAMKAANRITFDKMSVQYPKTHKLALQSIELQIEPGDRVAVLGKTGSGKSTLLRALLGMISLKEGEIRLDGINIRDYDRASYVQKFGVLQQESHLFRGSIGQNIALSEALIDPERIQWACKHSGFDQVIPSLPDGLNSQIGEGGAGLSGGQKRLLVLARLLYEDRPIIVLDEPTSSLDPASEMQVVTRLTECMGDRTVIFVTHRPAPLRLATKIAVIDEGRLVEFGDRDVVLAKLQANAAAQQKN
jgi:ATP-binding cassette subfamily C protein LapB